MFKIALDTSVTNNKFYGFVNSVGFKGFIQSETYHTPSYLKGKYEDSEEGKYLARAIDQGFTRSNFYGPKGLTLSELCDFLIKEEFEIFEFASTKELLIWLVQ